MSRDPWRRVRFDRRAFLVASATATVAVACGGGKGPEPSARLSSLVAVFPDGFRQAPVLVAGIPQRLAFVVRDDVDYMRESAPPSVDLRITLDGTTIVHQTTARRADGIITPYYSLPVTFGAPGQYEAALVDHPDVSPVPFLVVDASEVTIPQVGDSLPLVATATTDDARGVNPICTRAVPCPFHERSFADVAANDRPTVLLIATPGFCQTDICGPVVDLLIDEVADTGRTDLDAIHVEVYVDPSAFESGGFPDLTPLVDRLTLPFEPVLFVLGPRGEVRARLDTTFDRSELREALALVTPID